MKTLKKIIVLLIVITAATLMGCAGNDMNGTMNSSMDTMSEEKMDTGMKSMPAEEMQNVQNDDMEKSMDKTMK